MLVLLSLSPPINKVPSFYSMVLAITMSPPLYNNSVGSIESPVVPVSIQDIDALGPKPFKSISLILLHIGVLLILVLCIE